MIPLCLVTGFLGTGKTSLLKHVVESRRAEKLVYLVNEFSAEDVDGAVLLATENPDVVRLPGGSIFCKCLVSQFVSQLNAIPQRFPEAEGVVIEASGMANPKVIETMLAETRLDERFSLSGIITVVDRRSFTALRHTLPNILAQVESADVIVVNKTDLAAPDQLENLENELRHLNSRASIIRAVHGRVDLDLFGHAGRRGLRGELSPCRDPLYASDFVSIPGDLDIAELREGIQGHASEILRAKGFVRSGGKTWYVDYSTAGMSLTESPLPPIATTGIAVILRGDASAHTQAWLETLRQAGAAPARAAPRAGMTPRVVFVGGFLGAGKTSAIRAVARLAAARGRVPGAITNDQAAELVDTSVLRRAGIPVREVAGSCFCCNFHGFAAAVKALIAEEGVDLIFAEPVGSCTDLIATVLHPIAAQLGAPVEVAPVSVLVDPARLGELRAAPPGPARWSMAFLLDNQLREADLAVLSKNDLHDDDARQRAAEDLRIRAPQAAIVSVSSRTGAGLDMWLDFMLSGKPMIAALRGLDYAEYARAEAEMGWLNARAATRLPVPRDAEPLARSLVTALQKGLERANAILGNLKLELATPRGTVKAGASTTAAEPDVEGDSFSADRWELVVNLRAAVDPETLSALLDTALDQTLRADGGSAVLLYLNTFRPSPPKPTFRE